MFESTTHVYLTPIAAARADDFDRFLRDVVAPAVDARRPQQAGRWRTLRPDAPDGDTVTFVFLLDGGDLEDWDLGPVLEEHYGKEQAERHFRHWGDLAVPVRRWAEGVAAGAEEGEDGIGQVGWTCAPAGGASVGGASAT